MLSSHFRTFNRIMIFDIWNGNMRSDTSMTLCVRIIRVSFFFSNHFKIHLIGCRWCEEYVVKNKETTLNPNWCVIESIANFFFVAEIELFQTMCFHAIVLYSVADWLNRSFMPESRKEKRAKNRDRYSMSERRMTRRRKKKHQFNFWLLCCSWLLLLANHTDTHRTGSQSIVCRIFHTMWNKHAHKQKHTPTFTCTRLSSNLMIHFMNVYDVCGVNELVFQRWHK